MPEVRTWGDGAERSKLHTVQKSGRFKTQQREHVQQDRDAKVAKGVNLSSSHHPGEMRMM